MKRKVGRPKKLVEAPRQLAPSPKKTTEHDRSIGKIVADLRKSKKISQTALGAALNVTFQQIQKYESGTNRIGAARLSVIAQVLEVPLSTFFDDGEGCAAQMPPESLDFLKVPEAADLLRAFNEIEDDQVRREILTVVRGVSSMSKKLKI